MRIRYEDWNPGERAQALVNIANSICEEYAAQGYDLTIRQLYYQFVARDYIPNNQREYKSLATTMDRARRAGLMDWDYIVDRTRNLVGYTNYEDPGDMIARQADRFHLDLWENQDTRVEVWVEKEALAGVVQRAALSRGVSYF